MKSSKKHYEQVAKSLFKNSLTTGAVDDKKVHLILSELAKNKPAGLTSILKSYKRLITHKLKQEEIVVETNDKITLQKSFTDNLKKKTGARRIVNKIDKSAVFGAKIYHGDWIWDDTLSGKLKQITN